MSICCPKCSQPVNARMVATSKSTEVGIVRRRYCACGACVVTVEQVIDADVRGMLVEGLERQDRSLVRQLAKRLGASVTELDP